MQFKPLFSAVLQIFCRRKVTEGIGLIAVNTVFYDLRGVFAVSCRTTENRVSNHISVWGLTGGGPTLMAPEKSTS